MEHLRFCGSLNIACGYAGEQGFCTLTRCPVVLDGIPAAMKGHRGNAERRGRLGSAHSAGPLSSLGIVGPIFPGARNVVGTTRRGRARNESGIQVSREQMDRGSLDREPFPGGL